MGIDCLVVFMALSSWELFFVVSVCFNAFAADKSKQSVFIILYCAQNISSLIKVSGLNK